MDKLIIEVGSTCTKIDKYDGEKIEHVETITIEFKKNYKKENKLSEDDVKRLIKKVIELKSLVKNIYICGTSIFRSLPEPQKEEFLDSFKKKTGFEFEIISQEDENVLTVLGTTKNIRQKVAILIGGGGSTEITIFENRIKEMINTPIGVIDILNKYPDLADDIAITDLETVKKEVKEKLNMPKEKADILILAGGAHKHFALNSGITYTENILYKEETQPIMMDFETRKKDSERYYKEISLNDIKNKSNDPNWWNATRAMCAVVLVIAESIGAKYIVPTDISMVYGLLDK